MSEHVFRKHWMNNPFYVNQLSLKCSIFKQRKHEKYFISKKQQIFIERNKKSAERMVGNKLKKIIHANGRGIGGESFSFFAYKQNVDNDVTIRKSLLSKYSHIVIDHRMQKKTKKNLEALINCEMYWWLSNLHIVVPLSILICCFCCIKLKHTKNGELDSHRSVLLLFLFCFPYKGSLDCKWIAFMYIQLKM